MHEYSKKLLSSVVNVFGCSSLGDFARIGRSRCMLKHVIILVRRGGFTPGRASQTTAQCGQSLCTYIYCNSSMPPRYPSTLGPETLPPGIARSQRSRSRREPSGAFQLFQAPQIQQFKEAFSLIDQDGDGIVSERDLKAIFANLGEYELSISFP